MNDLISKQTAINAIHRYWFEKIEELPKEIMDGYEVYADTKSVNTYLKHNKNLSNIIKELQSAEPEIVLCKDCKYRSEGSTMFTIVTATSWCNKMAIPRLDEDSCGKGKRAKE